MRIVVISDSHGLHRKMTHSIPDGDILIHCGDITNNGELYQIKDFNDWIGDFNHSNKLVIAGNHDRSLEDYRRHEAKSYFTNCTYLESQEIIIDGVKFYGEPVQPWFYDWAFNRQRGAEIKKYWDAIPNDTNVLITHSPPLGILDILEGPPPEQHVGCEDLFNRIKELKQLKMMCFGHIHNSYSIKNINNVTYINAAICNERYSPVNKPIIIDI